MNLALTLFKLTLFLASAIPLFCQVVVKASTNIVSGDISVQLQVSGDKSYGGRSLPVLSIVCSQHGSRKLPPFVALTTDAVIVNFMGAGPKEADNLRATRIRLDEDTKPKFVVWKINDDQSTLTSGGPVSINSKFITERLLKSAKIHIELYVFGSGSRVSSFVLDGLQDEYRKREECRQ
jgi:hypothetical protein